jgi:hypothetical protein
VHLLVLLRRNFNNVFWRWHVFRRIPLNVILCSWDDCCCAGIGHEIYSMFEL